MRANKIPFKKGMFRAYKPLKTASYIASEELMEVLCWHMRAEYTEAVMGDWLTLGRDFGDYQEMVTELRNRLRNEDEERQWWSRAYRHSFLNS